MRCIHSIIGLLCFTLIFSQDIYDSEEESKESTDEDEDLELDSLYFQDISEEADDSDESNESEELKKIEMNVIKKISKRLEYRRSKSAPEENLNSTKTSKKRKKLQGPNDLLIPSIESCGLVRIKRTFSKVVGGKDSEIGAWPWMALLGYDFLTIAFMCSGALVTNRHVITAGHCINDALTIVRLGEYDTTIDNETKHLDINITKTLDAGFSSVTGRNDLAILILEKSVEFTDLISPICLPINKKLRKKSYRGQKPFVAGWGYTKENGTAAPILQELQTTVLKNKVCYDSFKANNQLKAKDQFDKSVLCVGDTTGGKDTCQGDSGGPLMMPELVKGTMHFFLIGVVSQGIGCARKDLAGSYTNVPHYMKWILENLK